MTDTASERIRIEAPADRCFDVAVDFESYPEWLRDVKEAKILESDDEGRGLRVEYRAAALGKSIRYVLEYDYSEAPERVLVALRRGRHVAPARRHLPLRARGPDARPGCTTTSRSSSRCRSRAS